MGNEREADELQDVKEYEGELFDDERGYFIELYNQKDWKGSTEPPLFVQDNMSCSRKGTLRGLHYQIDPHSQGKLVRVLSGSVYDVAVDLRQGSPTCGKWKGWTLTEKSGLGLWIPKGFAHGFLALEDNTQVMYKCDEFYAPNFAETIKYDDETLNIEWPIEIILKSPGDENAPAYDVERQYFRYEPVT